jgi:hypothetical protein
MPKEYRRIQEWELVHLSVGDSQWKFVVEEELEVSL